MIELNLHRSLRSASTSNAIAEQTQPPIAGSEVRLNCLHFDRRLAKLIDLLSSRTAVLPQRPELRSKPRAEPFTFD